MTEIVPRPPKRLVTRFSKHSTSTLAEVLGKRGFMNHEIKPIALGTKVTGPALTVQCHVGDNLMLHKAIEISVPGDVLVVNAGGYKEAGGMWGEIMALAAKLKRIEGLVIDGAVRDVAAMRKMRFKVFTRAISPGGTVKETGGLINKPVVCGGMLVNPGDMIVGDDDGVVVVPRDRLEEVIVMADKRVKKEEEIMKQLLQGKTTIEIYGFEKTLTRVMT